VEENVLISAGPCSVSILPRLGVKVAQFSFRITNCSRLRSIPCPRTRTQWVQRRRCLGWGGACLSCAQRSPNPARGATISRPRDVWREAVGRPVARTEESAPPCAAKAFSLPGLERNDPDGDRPRAAASDAGLQVTTSGTTETPWSGWRIRAMPGEDGRYSSPADPIQALRIEMTPHTGLGQEATARRPGAGQTDRGRPDRSAASPAIALRGGDNCCRPLAAPRKLGSLGTPKVRCAPAREPSTRRYALLGLWICQDGYRKVATSCSTAWPWSPAPRRSTRWRWPAPGRAFFSREKASAGPW